MDISNRNEKYCVPLSYHCFFLTYILNIYFMDVILIIIQELFFFWGGEGGEGGLLWTHALCVNRMYIIPFEYF